MSTNNIDTLRTHLFSTLEALTDKSKSVDLERIKAIQGIAQTIINSAMVEVKFTQVTGKKTGTFLDEPEPLPKGITGVTQHRIQG
jgi:hypothetical protein